MKKKIVLTSIVVLSLALVVAVGVTVAYLFVKTDPVENIFTPSNVNVSLEEKTGNSYQMIPGVEMDKDPKVTASGDIPYYVFVKITETGSVTIEGETYLFDDFLSYAIADGWTLLSGDTNNTTVGNDEIVVYKAMAANTSLSGDSVIKGDKITTNSSVTKQMMNAYTDGSIKLTFTAYVIQQDYFANVADAWAELNK